MEENGLIPKCSCSQQDFMIALPFIVIKELAMRQIWNVNVTLAGVVLNAQLNLQKRFVLPLFIP